MPVPRFLQGVQSTPMISYHRSRGKIMIWHAMGYLYSYMDKIGVYCAYVLFLLKAPEGI